MERTTSGEPTWIRAVWVGLLVAASAALTTAFTCITPFAAFSVMAATALSRRNAFLLTVAVWLANQAVGYGALHYPWTVNSAAWGIAIGGAAVVSTLAAQWTVTRLVPPRIAVQALAGFVAAFGIYQLSLYAVAVSILGGTGAFAPRIVGQVLLVNTVTLVGLYGVSELFGAAVRILSRRRLAAASPARFA